MADVITSLTKPLRVVSSSLKAIEDCSSNSEMLDFENWASF